MKKILLVGNALVDKLYQNIADDTLSALSLLKGGMTLIDTDRYASLQQLMAETDEARTTGGSAANTAKALGHLGDRPSFVGMVGRDEEGSFFESVLRESGVMTCLLTDAHQRTGVVHAFISPDGERTMATHLGAAATMDTDLIDSDLMRGSDVLYLEGYMVQNHALVMKLLRVADALGMEIALDLSSYNIVAQERSFFRQILADYVDIVFANEHEAVAFAFPDADPNKATEEQVETAATMLSRICRTAVVKRGSKGAICIDNDCTTERPSLAVGKVVDTTAAGDYFAAGFLHAYANSQSIEQCVEYGNRLASEIIQVVGTKLPDTVWQSITE